MYERLFVSPVDLNKSHHLAIYNICLGFSNKTISMTISLTSDSSSKVETHHYMYDKYYISDYWNKCCKDEPIHFYYLLYKFSYGQNLYNLLIQTINYSMNFATM